MSILIFFIGLIFGAGITFSILIYISKRNERIQKEKNSSIYEEVLKKLQSNEVSFNSRVNNAVQLNVEIDSEGELQIMYFLDRQDISLFQDGDCIYTSSTIDKSLLEKILKIIWSKFSTNINDVVQLNNNTFDKRTFMIISGVNNSTNEPQEFEEINKVEYNLDDILDKINEVGYNNLTESEKQFLKKYK